jgi:uncharacterized membrane protein
MLSTPIVKRQLAGEQVVEALLAGVMLAYSAPQRGQKRVAARVAGAGLLLAAFAPALTRQILRIGAARRRVHLRTSIEIDRPVRDVFEFCRDFENFPRVVQSLHCIVDHQDGRSRWEVMSPSGEILAWNAQVTKYVPNAVIAWRSVPGSIVDCNGLIRFSPLAQGGTRLQIEVDYDPCHTGLSDAVRALFDSPRTEQLEADLARANFYIESQPPAPALDTEEADDTDTPAHSA